MEKKKLFSVLCMMMGIMMMCFFCSGFIWNRTSVSEFEGFYLCDTPEAGEYENPQTMKLSFNDEGNLMRTDGMRWGTLGTTTFRPYASYKIKGNLLTCKYKEEYSYYGIIEDRSGTDEFVLNEDGNLEAEGHVWYRITNEYTSPRTLMEVTETDFPEGSFSRNASFLGNKKLRRKDVEQVTFLSSLDGKTDDAWDVSENQDGTVFAWVDRGEKDCHVYIAADGGVLANRYSNNLFRYCINLKSVDFNESFYTDSVYTAGYMFAECRSLTELDITDFAENEITFMKKMFYNCTDLEELNMPEDIFSISEEADYSDIFTGTKWEGGSPLLDHYSTTVATGYILDLSEMSEVQSALRAHVFNSYDEEIGELVESGNYDPDEMMYALWDINEDKIPELFVQIGTEKNPYYEMYTFDVPACRVKSLSAEVSSDDYTGLHYRYVIRENIFRGMKDIDADGAEEAIDIYAQRDNNGYDFLAVYVDSVNVYSRQIEYAFGGIEADINVGVYENSNAVMYLHLHSETVEEYCGLLRYTGDEFVEILTMEDLVSDSQWLDSRERSYFQMNIENKTNSNLQLEFVLNSITLGSYLNFKIDCLYEGDQIKQTGYLAEINNSEYSFYTTIKRTDLYEYAGCEKNCGILETGDRVIADHIWLMDGNLWIWVESEDGQSGWISLGTELFFEVTDNESSADEKIEENQKIQESISESVGIDGSELYSLGNIAYGDAEYKKAWLYYKMVKGADPDYEDIDKKIQSIQSVLEEEDGANIWEKFREETESSDEAGNNDVDMKEAAAAAREDLYVELAVEFQKLGTALNYCTADIDQDGIEEVVFRRLLSDESQYLQEIYKYDREGGWYQHVSGAELYLNKKPGKLYFWKERKALVVYAEPERTDALVYTLETEGFKQLFQVNGDMSYLPEMTFQNLPAETADGVSENFQEKNIIWKNEEGLALKKEIYVTAFYEGEDPLWFDYSELAYSVYDLNGDGKLEMVVRGRAESDALLLYAFYIYNEADQTVRRIGTLKSMYDDFYYSPKFKEVAAYSRSSTHDLYTFYKITDTEVQEDFGILSDTSDKTWNRYFLSKKGGQKQLSQVPFGSEDTELWDSYTGDFAELSWNTADSTDSMMKETDGMNSYVLSEMRSAVYTWYEMNLEMIRELEEGEKGECYISCGTGEEFWTLMYVYACYGGGIMESDGSSGYTEKELVQAGYGLCDGFSGKIPEVPEEKLANDGIRIEGEKFVFSLATPEEKNLELQSGVVSEDGSADVVYMIQYYEDGWTDYGTISLHMIPNTHADTECLCALPYTIMEGEFTMAGEGNAADQNEETDGESEYIFADSNSRYLTDADVAGMSLQQLNYAKNEVYARAGRIFRSQELQAYFNSKSWYNGIYDPDYFDENMNWILNDYEKKNGEFLSKKEHELDVDGYSPR